MNNLRKIILYALIITFPITCFADNFGWKSIVDFAQHNKAVILLSVAGVSGLIGGVFLSKKLKKDRAFVDEIKTRASDANIATVRAEFLKKNEAELKSLEKKDSEKWSALHTQCGTDAYAYYRTYIEKKNFSLSDERVEQVNTLFMQLRGTKGNVEFPDFNKKLNITQVQVRERFTWLPTATFAVGGFCLLGAFGGHEITKCVTATVPYFPTFFPVIQDTIWNKNNRA